MRYEFHPEALDEYQEATLYYAERDPADPGSPRTLASSRRGCPSLPHARVSLRGFVHHRTGVYPYCCCDGIAVASRVIGSDGCPLRRNQLQTGERKTCRRAIL